MESFEFRDESQTPNREELLQLAINAARTGNRRPARLMFEQVLKQEEERFGETLAHGKAPS